MRKQLRNRLVELLESVDEGVRGIRKLSPGDAHTVLVDCYHAVLAVEEALEQNLSPEGFARHAQSSASLKEALEALNGVLGEKPDPGRESKACRGELRKWRRSLQTEPEVRPEWVFLPYNASMWDSMESVWLAARDRCDCYVVPIPYFQLGPDRRLQDARYEGPLFPDYLPVTDYRQYDLAARRPDAVFIHNPYDGNNYVTSVHPDYYARNLKQYTDMLVYIPYYANFGSIPDTFAQLPSFRYIDKVIVQSERAREAYLKYWPAGKIAALGSPKFDKVLSARQNPPPLPEEWAGIAKGRRLVFYNTTLTALLKHNEQYIRKLRSVMDHFRDDPDFVLLWRPHPLNLATVGSMRPQLLQAYREVVREYRESGAGIYDDSADLHRAIALSSVYYGDSGSSLAAMYAVTGKPVIWQEVEQASAFNAPALVLSGLTAGEDGKLWATMDGYHAAARLDFDKGAVLGVYRAADEFLFGQVAPRPAAADGTLFCAPLWGKQLMIIDQKTGAVTGRPLDRDKKGANPSMPYSFLGAVRQGDEMFFLPFRYRAILRYHLQRNEWQADDGWRAPLIQTLGKEPLDYFTQNGFVRGGSVFLPVGESNLVMEYDTSRGKAGFHRLGGAGNRYSGLLSGRAACWMMTADEGGPMVRWDDKTGETTEYREYPPGFRGGAPSFADMVWYGDEILLFPLRANMIVRLDPNTGKMTEFTGLPVDPECELQYAFATRQGDWIYAYARFDRCLYRLHAGTGEVRKRQFQFTGEQYGQLLAGSKAGQALEPGVGIFHYLIPEAAAQGSLCGFLRILLADGETPDFGTKTIFRNIAENLDGTAGEKICDYVMKFFP